MMTTPLVVSWGSPTHWLRQIICGGRLSSRQKAAIQECVGPMVNISTGVHGMLERWTTSIFLPSHRAAGQSSPIYWRDT